MLFVRREPLRNDRYRRGKLSFAGSSETTCMVDTAIAPGKTFAVVEVSGSGQRMVMRTIYIPIAALVVLTTSCSGCSGCSAGSVGAGMATKPVRYFKGGPKSAEDEPLRSITPRQSVNGKEHVTLSLHPGPAAKNVPIRTGVPFPFGAISSVDRLRLESGDGSRQVPAQFDALAKWPDGSLKVVLVQLVGDLGASTTYRLAYGAGVTRSPASDKVTTTRANGKLGVDTGQVKFTVNSKGVLDALWRDTNEDGRFASNEQLIDGGDIFLVNAFDGQEYRASLATNATITLEETGPLRAVVRAQGRLTSAQRTTHLRYLVRYYASQGSDKVDVEFTVIDDRLEKNVRSAPSTLAVALKGLGMRWHFIPDGATAYRFGGQSGNVYAGNVSGEHYLLQTGQWRFVDGQNQGYTFAYSGVGTGQKAPGWLELSAGAHHAAVMVRDFWQQFPMELSITGNTITAALFPQRSITGAPDTAPIVPEGKTYRRPNTFYFLHAGGAKTYQLRLTASRDALTTTDLASLNESFQRHEFDLVATPGWYTSSGVWGDLAVGGPDSSSAAYDAGLIKNIYQPSVEKPNGGMTVFGWRDYGCRLRAGWADVINGQRIPSFYNDTHVGAGNFFKQFLRTGDQRWFQLGDISTRHVMDIDVSHGPRQGYWKTGKAPQPAGELLCISHENVDHETRNLHWGHAHVSGLTELYLLTGDKRALEVLKEIAKWWEFVAPHFFPLPFDVSEHFREAERDYAWPLYVMNEYVRVTGDRRYHRKVAGRLVNYLIEWWQTPLDHIGYNPATGVVSNDVIGVNDARAGTGFWTMTRMGNTTKTANLATGTNPWMAGALIANVIKFLEQDMQFATVGEAAGISHRTLQDMLLQAQNYVVKYGYERGQKWFVYSETRRTKGHNDYHILFGLAYLDRMFKQAVAAGRLTHPEWYDTQPMWGEIAARAYDELRTTTVSKKQSYGFYGYEILYPPDYFKIMRDVLKR